MQISYFNGLPTRGQPHMPDGVMTVEDFLNSVKYGKWQDQIERIRQVADKEARNKLKRNIPAVTMSGTFRERNEAGLIQHSGLIAVDIDNWTDRIPLLADPYTFALFASASGGGICVLVRVNPERHKDSFRWLQHHYFVTYGISVDPAPSNVASMRYVSYDPDLYIADRSAKAKVKAEPKQVRQSLPVVLTMDQAQQVVGEVAGNGIDIAPDYESYLKLALSVASGFGEAGRDLFHTLCCPSPKYVSSQADLKYNHALEEVAKGRSKVTVGTLYWMLNRAGIQLPKASSKVVQIAALGKASGRSAQDITEQLITVNGLPAMQARELVGEVMGRQDIDLGRVASDPENLIECAKEWLQINHPLRKNAITGKLEENGTEVSEERLNTIYLRARVAFNKNEITFDLVNRMIFSELTPTFNPIQEYIERNRHRNSGGNIDRLIATIRTPTEGAAVFIRKWVLSWIAALNGRPVRSVLTLVGGQNTGKTEWFRRLPPSGLRKYYAESKLDSGKDDELLMCQKLWVIDDEMGGKSKQDEKRFKELTSKSTFSLRAAYARHNQDYKRLAVLGGSSNDEAVVNDPTGNTRILPIQVLSIDHAAYNDIDKDELFMEAVRAYESGEEWELSRAELDMLADVSSRFEPIPFERELIAKFFKQNDEIVKSFFTATEIKDIIETNTRQKIMSMQRLGIELRKLFGEPVSRKRNGYPSKCYQCRRIEIGDQYTDYEQVKDEAPF